MVNHTPGPWWIGPHQQIISSGWSIRIADGSAIAYVLGEKNPELKTNARLIAKAPALLESLQTLLIEAEPHAADNRLSRTCAIARKLIEELADETTP